MFKFQFNSYHTSEKQLNKYLDSALEVINRPRVIIPGASMSGERERAFRRADKYAGLLKPLIGWDL